MNNFPTHPTSRRLSDALNPLCPTKTPQCNVGELCAEPTISSTLAKKEQSGREQGKNAVKALPPS